MSGRLLLAGLGVAAVALLLLARGTDGPPRSGDAVAPSRLPRSIAPTTPVEAPTTGPTRDLFRYADAQAVAEPAPAARPVPSVKPSPPVTAPPARPLRLVGLVRRAGGLKAALFFAGELHMLGPGESAGGYQVLSLDEEAGVRLRGPDGAEFVLAPPGS